MLLHLVILCTGRRRGDSHKSGSRLQKESVNGKTKRLPSSLALVNGLPSPAPDERRATSRRESDFYDLKSLASVLSLSVSRPHCPFLFPCSSASAPAAAAMSACETTAANGHRLQESYKSSVSPFHFHRRPLLILPLDNRRIHRRSITEREERQSLSP